MRVHLFYLRYYFPHSHAWGCWLMLYYPTKTSSFIVWTGGAYYADTFHFHITEGFHFLLPEIAVASRRVNNNNGFMD